MTTAKELRQLTNEANTPSRICNRIIKECKTLAMEGKDTYYVKVPLDKVEEVVANLTNEFCNLEVRVGSSGDLTVIW